jgi:nicotinamide riboside transporter PnuC
MQPATLTELLISIITLISGWFIGNKSVWGQRLGLLANLCWWVYVAVFKRYGFIPMEIFFTIITIRNLIKWEKEK